MNGSPDDRETRFRTAYGATYDDVLRFVPRRSDPDRAQDIVAEAMLVAWRRVDDLPAGTSDARAWLFGIARNCLLTDARSARRRDALAVRLARVAPPTEASPPDDADLVARRVDLARAWRHLSAAEQETLALTVFEGLDSTRAGAVLGISSTAYRLRLSRARRALRRHLEGAATGDAPECTEVSS